MCFSEVESLQKETHKQIFRFGLDVVLLAFFSSGRLNFNAMLPLLITNLPYTNKKPELIMAQAFMLHDTHPTSITHGGW